MRYVLRNSGSLGAHESAKKSAPGINRILKGDEHGTPKSLLRIVPLREYKEATSLQ
jgi:hypothetical protein